MRSATGRLAAVDEANLVLDHVGQVNVFLIAGIAAPGGFIGDDGRPDVPALRAELASRIASLPELRRVPVPVRSGRRHRWVEATPDLERHVRLVDPVEGLSGLEQACGALMTVPLTLERPPWELLVVPGASRGGVGFVLRIHHAIADGVAAAAIAQRLFEQVETDAAADATPGGSRGAGTVRPALGSAEPPAGRRPIRVIGRIGYGLRRIVTTLVGRGIGATVLLGDRGPRRGVVFLDVDLAALEAHVRPLGATANDALLTAVAAGYAAALSAVGEAPPAELPVSVPVALRRRGSSGNQVGIMLVRLPLHATDPEARLQLIAARTRKEKERARAQGTLELMRGPRGAHIMDRIARRQHLVAGFVTNVPGPSARLRLAGAPVEALWPVAVLAANVRLGVAAVSYAGALRCGIHFDADAVPGAQFARAMSAELARLTG